MPKDEGLIAAYILDGKGSARQIYWEEINHWTPEQGFLWVHANYTSQEVRQWLAKHGNLDPITIKALTAEDTRPRSVIAQNHLMIFLRGVNLNPGHNPRDMVSIRLWINEHRVISLRNRRLLSIEDIRSAISQGHGPKSPADFLVMLNARLITRMADVLDKIESHVDSLEQKVMTTESHLLRPQIADIRRQAISIRRYLAPQREALNRLLIEKTPLLDETKILNLREETDRLIRYIEDLDAARDRAVVTQEELSSRLSEQMDKRMYLLSLVAIVFLPITFLTGLLGVNVAGIPGAESPLAFATFCGILLLIVSITFWIFKRKKLI